METAIKSPEKLGTLLIRSGAISEQDLETALKLQKQEHGRLGETLIEMGVLSAKVLVGILAVVAVPAVPGNLGPFEAAVAFGIAGAGLVEQAGDAPSVAFAVLLHVVNLGTYILMGLIGLWYEDVSLGEVTRAAQSLRAQRAPTVELDLPNEVAH